MGYFMVAVKGQFAGKMQKKLAAAGPKAAHDLAVQIAEDTKPYVPARTGALSERTQVVGNRIVYPGPYAKYLYDGKAMVDADTGMGPMRLGGKNGAEVIRFRKGARLKASARPLRFRQTVHPLAQDHWFEASKAKNLENWLQSAGKAVKNELQ